MEKNQSVDIVAVKTDVQIREVANLAAIIWHEHFEPIIGIEQVNYMIGKFQSYEAIRSQISEEGYMYFRLLCNDVLLGYIGLQMRGKELFLSKLYVHKEARGQGLASTAVRFITEFARKKGLTSIRLTCNKYNTHTLKVYEHMGFKRIDSQVTDIGNGFVMDDYILQLQL